MSGKDRAIDFFNSVLVKTQPYRRFIFAVILLVAIGTGLLFYRTVGETVEITIQEPTVSAEIMAEKGGDQTSRLTVSISGGVKISGVYEVGDGARIIDIIDIAGGLSDEADTRAIDKNINFAEKLYDGQKVYIPKIDDNANGEDIAEVRSNQSISGKISINRATQSELDSLPGIGEVRSKAIIANRPYSATQELVSKKVIPNSVYQDIVNLISL